MRIVATVARTSPKRLRVVGAVVVLLLVGALGVLAVSMLSGGSQAAPMEPSQTPTPTSAPSPTPEPVGLTVTSAAGLFLVTVFTETDPVPINRLHSWTVRITSPTGTPVDGATLSIDGDMPEHGHGLPTRPQVTKALGDGRYLIEGMQFQMPGWWYVDISIVSNGVTDRARLEFTLR